MLSKNYKKELVSILKECAMVIKLQTYENKELAHYYYKLLADIEFYIFKLGGKEKDGSKN